MARSQTKPTISLCCSQSGSFQPLAVILSWRVAIEATPQAVQLALGQERRRARRGRSGRREAAPWRGRERGAASTRTRASAVRRHARRLRVPGRGRPTACSRAGSVGAGGTPCARSSAASIAGRATPLGQLPLEVGPGERPDAVLTVGRAVLAALHRGPSSPVPLRAKAPSQRSRLRYLAGAPSAPVPSAAHPPPGAHATYCSRPCRERAYRQLRAAG
jgi:hypothetical protein